MFEIKVAKSEKVVIQGYSERTETFSKIYYSVTYCHIYYYYYNYLLAIRKNTVYKLM